MSTHRDDDRHTRVSLRDRDATDHRHPRMYRVMLHNDDYTPMDFVVRLLETVFHRGESEATVIMLHVHNRGTAIAGVYTHEIAETKVAQVQLAARTSDHPLMTSMEPVDDDDDDDR